MVVNLCDKEDRRLWFRSINEGNLWKILKKILKICDELEKLNETFLIKGVPEEYKEIWVPNNEIKLWQIPRTSAEVLKCFALANKSKVILELGTSAGYSAIWLASAARQFDGKVYTIELAKPKIEMAKNILKKQN